MQLPQGKLRGSNPAKIRKYLDIGLCRQCRKMAAGKKWATEMKILSDRKHKLRFFQIGNGRAQRDCLLYFYRTEGNGDCLR
jgi:hypothetical protein